jgi:hypothetical protein
MNEFFSLQRIRKWLPLTAAFCMNTVSTLGTTDQCHRIALPSFMLKTVVVLHWSIYCSHRLQRKVIWTSSWSPNYIILSDVQWFVCRLEDWSIHTSKELLRCTLFCTDCLYHKLQWIPRPALCSEDPRFKFQPGDSYHDWFFFMVYTRVLWGKCTD